MRLWGLANVETDMGVVYVEMTPLVALDWAE